MEHIRIFKTKKDYTDSFSGDVLSSYPAVLHTLCAVYRSQ